MLKYAMVALFVLSGSVAAFAQEKKAIPVAECGQMWKAHKASSEYTDPGKYKRSEAWNTFRKEKCSKDRQGA
jgi:hypothetical protein